MQIGLYHHSETSNHSQNLFPSFNIYKSVYKFETIMQNPCQEEFDGDNFGSELLRI